MEAKGRTLALLYSQAPGVGGGEKVALAALARMKSVRVEVAGHPEVAAFAGTLGFRTHIMKFPRAHRIRQLPSILLRGISLARLVRTSGAGVLYANGTRAMPHALVAGLVSRTPLLVHHQGLLTSGPVGALKWALSKVPAAVVVSSRASGSQLRPETRIHVIPSGVDTARFRPSSDREAARAALGLPERRPVAATVTRADPRKGMREFVELARMIAGEDREIGFLLVGGATFPAEQRSYQAVLDSAESLGESLVATGVLEDPLPAFFASDVFVHLSEPEAFPTTALEAMSCGVPVVGFDWGGLSEMVEDGRTGYLVEPGDLEAAASATMRLIRDAPLRSKMGAEARARVEQRYTLDRFAGDLEELIVALSGNGP